jgi:hypothetical protein
MNDAITKQGPREQKAERLFDVADQQAGYFTARQALEAGYDYPLQHYHRERGHWTQVGHGLFRLNRYPEGENEDLVRLSLWSRDREGKPQAVVSHETALRLHGLSDLMPEKAHLSVPRNGFRVTTPLKTILDVAGSREVSPEHLESAVREAVVHGLVRRKRLYEELSRLEDDERRRIAEEAIHKA